MTHPTKDVDKIYRHLGATRVGKDARGVTYQFPDGAHRNVPSNVSVSTAGRMIREVTARYGNVRSAQFDRALKRPHAPTVNLEKTVASDHAKERLALMREQVPDLTLREVLHALRLGRTRWSPEHGSWLWIGDRVTVAAHVSDDGWTRLTTVMWSTAELWRQNPRPKELSRR